MRLVRPPLASALVCACLSSCASVGQAVTTAPVLTAPISSTSNATITPDSTETIRLTFSDATPSLNPRQVITKLPEGWAFSFLIESSTDWTQPSPDSARSETFFTDDADSTKQWLTIKVAKLDKFELAAFNPLTEPGTSSTVSGKPASRRQLDDLTDMLTFGPLGSYSIRLVSRGVDNEAIDAIASHISLADGELVLSGTDAAAPLRFRVTASGRANDAFGLGNAAADDIIGANVAVGYKRAGNNIEDLLTINTVEVHGPDPLALIRFGGHTLTPSAPVHGVESSASEGGNDQASSLSWVEGGRLVSIFGSFTVTELHTMAESVRGATDDEWAALKATPVSP
jgi:hypothetical protein